MRVNMTVNGAYPQALVDRVCKAYLSGLSQREVGELTGVGAKRVHRILKASGTPSRTEDREMTPKQRRDDAAKGSARLLNAILKARRQ